MTAKNFNEFIRRHEALLPELIKLFHAASPRELKSLELTIPQFTVLRQLAIKGNQRMSDLARSMEVTLSNITALVDRLIGFSYVKRQNDPADRRIVRVKLTAKGKDLAERIMTHQRRQMIKLMAKFTVKDRADYLRIMGKLIKAIKNERGKKND